jgi:hypothetical protein
MEKFLPMVFPELSTREILAALVRTDKLLVRVAKGGYDDREITELRSLCEILMKKIGIPQSRIVQNSAVTTAVLRNTLAGGNPKLQNFLAILYGLRLSVLDLLEERGIIHQVNPNSSAVFLRFHLFTNAGEIENLIVQLSDLFQKLRGQNDPSVLVSEEARMALIELLQNVLGQLKSGVVEIRAIDGIKGQLKSFGNSVKSKVENHASENVAATIIKLLSQLFY